MNSFAGDPTSAFEQADALIVDRIQGLRSTSAGPVLIGLCGPQGSGKSFTAARLVKRLQDSGLNAVARSIDDFYLTREERHALAQHVHPLLATRGVPGTHDLVLLNETLDRLCNAGPTAEVQLPTFDKTIDDRAPASDWPVFCGPAVVIILEGWCVGARPQPASGLAEPVNRLEAEEDPEGVWRAFVNDRLASDYANLFDRLDLKVMLKAPSFDCIFDWRAEQEAKLDRRADGSKPPMTAGELQRFIAHYERVTRWLMADEPVDLVIEIDRGLTPRRWFNP